MKTRYRFMLGGFIACCVLFWMSGAPLERGWPLWGAGCGTILVTLFCLAIGYGCERARKEGGDE